jgi:phytanoyl-CoA hydroxylase
MRDLSQISAEYRQNGVIRLKGLLSAEKVAEIRTEFDRYISQDLPTKPLDARTTEADETTVRNLWRLEQHNPYMLEFSKQPEIRELVAELVRGEPVLIAIETFNKPARIGSGVPYHQDNAYFCQSPPDVLTLWIAIDAVTLENGPVYFITGSHEQGMLPTRPSGIRGNSIGLADPPNVPLTEQFCGLLAPGDATIHHCNTIHHSAPNTTDHSRLGLLLVFRGSHTELDPTLRRSYTAALATTPPT